MNNKAQEFFSSVNRFLLLGYPVIAAIVIVTYFGSLRIGLAGDDLDFFVKANMYSLPDYLTHYFDPRTPFYSWYRPLFGVYFWIQYALFGNNVSAFHAVTVLQHILNSWLLLALLSGHLEPWRAAFLAALIYVAAISTYSAAIIGLAAQDPLMTTFVILSIGSWLKFLQDGRRKYYWLATAAYVLALLSKETAVMLLPTLYCLERMRGVRPNVVELFKRYSVFVAILAPYALAEYTIQRSGFFVRDLGYGPGAHMLFSAANYLSVAAFPWVESWSQVSLLRGLVLFLLLAIILVRRNRQALFLIFIAVLSFLPVTAIQDIPFEPRYLYLSLMVSAIFLAAGIEWTRKWVVRHKAFRLGSASALTLLILASSLNVAQATEEYDWFIRARRVPFRDISQKHSEFPEDTFLYFIDPPLTPIRDLQGMFALRYGARVSIGSAVINQPARLRDHNVAYVYYFDETGRAFEIAVDQAASTRASPELPAEFQIPIQLEGYEITSSTVKRGESLALILYWRALNTLEKDYTVFVHLVDANGQIVGGYDGPPNTAARRTSLWQPNQFAVDPRVISIAPDLPIGRNYTFQVGLYYLPALERLGIVDANGRVFTDKVIIAPVEVTE